MLAEATTFLRPGGLDKLTFGQMASRSVDDTDRKLAEELYELADYLVEWPEDEPIRQ